MNLDCLKKKCTNLLYLDKWANTVPCGLVLKGIDKDSVQPLKVVGFKLKGSSLTTYNHFRRDKRKIPAFFNYKLVLCNILIPSGSKDLL